MKIWGIALILVHKIFLSDAEWDENGALIMVKQTRNSYYIFPRDVRYNQQGVKVYHPRNSPASYTTYSFCPVENDSNRFCNYGESWNRNSEHSLRTVCPLKVEPRMIMIFDELPPDIYYNPQDDGRRRCANGVGSRFNFVYYLCYQDSTNREEEVIYETCYNDNAMQIIYGYYTIEKPKLLTNDLLIEEQSAHFDYDNDDFGYQSFNNQFRNFVEPSYALSSFYTQRPVLPPELLPFAIQRRPLYHYMNLSPMHVDVVGTWETFLNNLRRKLAKESELIHIIAGVIYLSQFRQGITTPFLGNVPIPDIFWLLIYNQKKTKGIVVMIHNKSYHSNEEKYLFSDMLCEFAYCAQSRLSEAIPAVQSAFMYCCSVNVLQNIYPFEPVSDFFRFQKL